jgi:pSer/pThr/pTyr-binding forkhead associated (FHA) protein
MVQLQILSGRRIGQWVPMDEFPFSVGRGASVALGLDEPGVWEKHFQFELDPADGFFVKNSPPAITTVNGSAVDRVRLKNGDLVEAGGAKLRFWLSAPRQLSLRPREVATWAGIVGLCLLQLAILYFISS